jgi:hypothetical protein
VHLRHLTITFKVCCASAFKAGRNDAAHHFVEFELEACQFNSAQFNSAQFNGTQFDGALLSCSFHQTHVRLLILFSSDGRSSEKLFATLQQESCLEYLLDLSLELLL